MQKRKPLDVVLLIFKIVIPVFLAFLLIFFSFDLYDQKMLDLASPDTNQTVSIDAFPLAFAILLIVMLLAVILALIVSLAGLIISIVYKQSAKRKKHILAYSLISAACPLSFFLFLLIGRLIESIGA